MSLVKINDIHAGMEDAKNDIKRNKRDFLDSYENPPSLDFQGQFIDGVKCFIIGDKGLGKTAAMRYLNQLLYDKYNSISSFILFEQDYNKTAMEADAGQTVVTYGVERDEMLDMPDFSLVWRWHIYLTIIRDNADGKIFSKDKSWKKFSGYVMGIFKPAKQQVRVKGEVNVDLKNYLPPFLNFISPNINIEFPDLLIGPKNYTFEEAMKQADEEFEKLVRLFTPYYIFIDELDIYYDERNYLRDLRLVHDLVWEVRRLNDFFHDKNWHNNTKVFCTLRPEVIHAIEEKIPGKSIQNEIKDFSHTLSWTSDAQNAYSLPIIKLLMKRIERAEMKKGLYGGNERERYERWFPERIDGMEPSEYIRRITWSRPRDIVRLLNAARSRKPFETHFSEEVFQDLMRDYSSGSVREIKTELSVRYSADQLEKIFNSFAGLPERFSREEFEQNMKDEGWEGETGDVLADLYRVGAIGQEAGGRIRWAYLGDQRYQRRLMNIVHRGLVFDLGVEEEDPQGKVVFFDKAEEKTEEEAARKKREEEERIEKERKEAEWQEAERKKREEAEHQRGEAERKKWEEEERIEKELQEAERKKKEQEEAERKKREENINVSNIYKYVIHDNGTIKITGLKKKDIKELVIPDSIEGKVVTSIGSFSFRKCKTITSIKLPLSLTTIGEWAFSGCSGLTNIELPDGLTTIGASVFDGCIGLTSIELPDGITSIGDWEFSGCSGLTSIELPDGITTIGRSAFYGCSGLTSIELPSTLITIGNRAFGNCSGLTNIELPDGLTTIGESTFSGCSGLTSIKLPFSLTTIGNSTFVGCSGLTSIELPDGITTIGRSAFYGCSGLTSIKIPKSVAKIGYVAFSHCNNLTLIVEKDSYAENYVKDNNIRYEYSFSVNTQSSISDLQETYNQKYKNFDLKNVSDSDIEWFIDAAQSGLSDAQFSLGEIYYYGYGVKEDDSEAVKWYRKSAEQGNAEAQYSLGYMFFNGLGVSQSNEEAVKWYRKAAEQGNVAAQYYLGWMYENGIGVDKNIEEAKKWYKLAADQGYRGAKKRLEELG